MWGCRGNLSSFDVSLPCQATMAELQEVQITEEKPLLPGQTPEVAKVIRDPLTPRPEFQISKPPHLLPEKEFQLPMTSRRSSFHKRVKNEASVALCSHHVLRGVSVRSATCSCSPRGLLIN